jgi:hypothetical protein
MISTLSRGNDLTVSHDDLVRAQDWLLEAESKMPDIFRDMAGKSDKVVIDDLHDFMWKMYTRDKKPLHESKLIMFLKGKVPTEKVFRILELCERSGVIERDRSQALPLYKPGSREMMRDVEAVVHSYNLLPNLSKTTGLKLYALQSIFIDEVLRIEALPMNRLCTNLNCQEPCKGKYDWAISWIATPSPLSFNYVIQHSIKKGS